MSNILEQAVDRLCDKHYLSYEEREAKARQVAQQIARNNRGVRNVEGLGQLTYEVPAATAKEWMHKEGPDVLKDKGWQKHMKRNHPELFATRDKRRNRVGYGD